MFNFIVLSQYIWARIIYFRVALYSHIAFFSFCLRSNYSDFPKGNSGYQDKVTTASDFPLQNEKGTEPATRYHPMGLLGQHHVFVRSRMSPPLLSDYISFCFCHCRHKRPWYGYLLEVLCTVGTVSWHVLTVPRSTGHGIAISFVMIKQELGQSDLSVFKDA